MPLWERAEPILRSQPEDDSKKASPGRLTGRVALEHVSFRYREDGPLVLDDITLHAEPGEFIAIVGPSGGGKSTLLRLLLGFETPITGTVYYDRLDLKELELTSVRRQLGVVLQSGKLSAGSIFENISGGALVSQQEAWEAAQMAGFAEDISSMPMQMHTVVSEGGTNLSGGQRQRLLIARSLVLKPRIILLDEATSSLDNRTQAIVTSSLDKLSATRIVIAHRLSTIRNADRIYVIEAGRVVQVGTFEELVKQEGLFAQLVARQME
jgi:ABC-type bacteriocin/lantibiotic exporter with double-glycine peptidase domain